MKNKLLYIIQVIVEKITGKGCNTCKHCSDAFCTNYKNCVKCALSIYPRGYEAKDK